MIPQINKTYNYFDDGKIRTSQRAIVTVIEVVPFEKIDNETLNKWKEEKESTPHLFANETDYFVRCRIKESEEDLIFVRTQDKGWFSFNNYLWDGRLDVDGSLNKRLKAKQKKYLIELMRKDEEDGLY